MNIKIKKLTDTAQIPTRGSEYAAGYDLYADMSDFMTNGTTLQPHTTVKIGTGIAIEIPEGYFGGIFPRSGLSTKKGLRPANTPGCIDADYRGEIIVALHNDSDQIQIIEKGERIAQLVVIPFLPVEFEEVKELSDTDRGSGGFGSTGTK